jgi:hypothetical protein
VSDLDFLSGLEPDQARAYLDQFREQGEREAVRQLRGAELDFSFESVAPMLEWLVTELVYAPVVEPPAPEPRGIFRRTPPAPPPEIRFDEPTKLRMTLAAWYFGETFVRRAERLYWDTGPEGIYYQLPMVRGFIRKADLAPQWVVATMMRRRVPEMKREEIPPIAVAIDTWRDQI